MNRRDNEELRRRQLIEAAIATIGKLGFARASLGEIAGRAGVSPGLVAHYFSDKAGLLEATLRLLTEELSSAMVERFRHCEGAEARIAAIVDSCLSYEQHDPELAAVWLAFWAEAAHSPTLGRVQRIYQRRLADNLTHAVRELVRPGEARRVAEMIACLIDGAWIRATLNRDGPQARQTRALVMEGVDAILAATRMEAA
ncbi:MAG: transcriptional regulator BetI [Flavobacteriaceae bacterium]